MRTLSQPTALELELKEKLADAGMQVDKLDRKLELLTQEIDRLQSGNRLISTRVDFMDGDNKRLWDENAELRDFNAKAHARISELETENERLADAITTFKAKISEILEVLDQRDGTL